MPEGPTHDRPVLVFDGECRFCRVWVAHWKLQTGDRIEYVALQDVGGRFHGVDHKAFTRSVHLIMPDGSASRGACAVFSILSMGADRCWMLWAYDHVPGFKWISEAVYNFIAARRGFAFRVTKALFGDPIPVTSFEIASGLFIRALGLIYFVAFLSLAVQIVGLVGSHGIAPFRPSLDTFRNQAGISSYWRAPTLTWLNPSDGMLQALSAVGVVAAFFLFLDALTIPALIVCWASYLSLVTVGQEFLSFQWDALLLEAGLLAVLLAWTRRLRSTSSRPATSLVAWLYRWLLFRLVFVSGLVKLASGDPSWRNLTALSFHYETQPLPTPLAWYAHLLPMWFQQASTLMTFVCELAVPFLFFAPRRLRHLAGLILISFQVLILLTGNYGFFNWFTIFLCLFLFDDAWFRRYAPRDLLNLVKEKMMKKSFTAWRRGIVVVCAVSIVVIGVANEARFFLGASRMPAPVISVLSAIAPFAPVNHYGLFAVMTTARLEITIEGSDDLVTWKEYPFRFTPDDVAVAPPIVAPYQPRLDWQMWFAALGPASRTRWFPVLIYRLLQGTPEVTSLFASNPFPDAPPKYIRAGIFEYHFTPSLNGGVWWHREYQGEYVAPVNLDSYKLPEPVLPSPIP